VASTVMGVAVYYLSRSLFDSNAFGFIQKRFLRDMFFLCLSIGLGGVVYIGMVAALKMDEFYSVKNWIFRKSKLF